MENTKGKIVKITFEYENMKESLAGEQAEDWLKKVNNMCILLEIRDQNPFKYVDFFWLIDDKANETK